MVAGGCRAHECVGVAGEAMAIRREAVGRAAIGGGEPTLVHGGRW